MVVNLSTMSKFSGKCDFADHVSMVGVEKTLMSTIYVGNNIVPLKFESEKDLIPYYPYIIGSAGYENGVGTIHLTDESFVDIQERELLENELSCAKREYLRCRRKKIYFNPRGSKYSGWCKAVWDRVAEHGTKATVDGLTIDSAEYYRQKLYEEMVAHGWEKVRAHYWCFHDINRALELQK